LQFFSFPLFAQEDSSTPGFEACLKNSSELNYNDCYENAIAYWDKLLNENYKKIKNICKQTKNETYCLSILLSTQRSWLAYRDGMVKKNNHKC
jgi:uncharacterized protein YecT (DUF1311 family)